MIQEINNNVILTGRIKEGFKFNHVTADIEFYSSEIQVSRTSGYIDSIPIITSRNLIDLNENYAGVRVSIRGQFRCYNDCTGKKTKKVFFVFVTEFKQLNDDEKNDINQIHINGYICKEPIYRVTPKGREITEILLAVNRTYKKTDYIHCIAWGNNAWYAKNLATKTKIHIEGRIQSREYNKKVSSEEIKVMTAYEVSVNDVEVLKDED